MATYKVTLLSEEHDINTVIDCNDDVFVLEINPRISASVELMDTEQPLFERHLAACLDQPMSAFSTTPVQRHLHTVFAPCDLITPDVIDWPETYHDRPKAKTLIKNGAPICTVLVETLMSFNILTYFYHPLKVVIFEIIVQFT